MNLPKITQVVNAKEYATFSHYEEGNLWYFVPWGDDLDLGPERFMFPVPVSDALSGRFLATDKSVFFMRWIRKHLEFLKESLAQEAK